jgi:hypothetical protein
MKPRFVVSGHSLLMPSVAKKVKPDLFKPHRAFCSCGAWADVVTVPSAGGRRKAQQNWHDEHKIEVLRSQGKLEEEI